MISHLRRFPTGLLHRTLAYWQAAAGGVDGIKLEQ